MRDRLDERRIALVIIGGAALLFVALYAVNGPAFETPDEAKYIGLGLNVLAGRGLVTLFDTPILYHAPVWPVALAISDAWFGLDPLAFGHVLEAASAVVCVVFTAALAWRLRPAAGAVAACALLATPYFGNLARTAGIDLPATAFALAYLWMALRAIDRASVRLGLVAGLLFGVGFLMKETVIPFAPIPFLVALLGPVPAGAIARVAAPSLLAAALTSGWWFVLYAQLTGRVYRLGGPAWLLIPIAVGVAIVVTAGLLESRLASSAVARSLRTRFTPTSSVRLRQLVAWGGLAIWLLGQLVIYAAAPKLAGGSIVRVSQLIDDLRVYGPQIGMIAAFAVVGGFLVLRGRASQPVNELLFAAVAQAPLIVLVLAIGETPRHYVATLCLGAALGALGFTTAVERAIRGSGRLLLVGASAIVLVAGVGQLLRARHLTIWAPRAVAAGIAIVIAIGVAAWVARRFSTRVSRVRPSMLVALALGVVFVGSATIATAAALRGARDPGGTARAAAVNEIGDWLRANAGGQTVMIGSQLAYELALEVNGDVEVVRLRPEGARPDGSTPTGLRLDVSGANVPLMLKEALHDVESMDAYDPAVVTAGARKAGAARWLDVGYLAAGVSATPMSAALADAEGTSLERQWVFPINDQALVVQAFRLDLERLVLPTDRTYAAPRTIEVLARFLERSNRPDAAAMFADRIVAVPAGEEADAALARLRAVAGSP